MLLDLIKKYKNWLIVAVVLILLNVAALLFLTLPKINSEQINQERVALIEKKNADLQGKLTSREEALEKLEANRNSLEEFYVDTLGTKSDRMTEILAEREKIATKFGVIPVRVRYASANVRNMPLERFTMSFPLSGTYESLRFFIDTLEHSENFYLIEDVELESSSGGPEDLSMRITVSTMFQVRRLDESGQVIGDNEEDER